MRTVHLPQRWTWSLHWAALFATIAALLVLPGTARADSVQCGAVLVANTTLDNDVVNCLGDGLVVMAHGITIDLNGKTLDGAGRGIGIRNDGYDGVTIKNGTVSQFQWGVQLNPGSVGNVLDALTVSHHEIVGVQLDGATQNEIRNTRIEFQANRGLEIMNGSTGNAVVNSTLFTNGDAGIFVQNSGSNRLQSNVVTMSGDTGIFVQNSSGGLFQSNVVTNNGDRGLVLEGSSGNGVYLNAVSNNSDGGFNLLLGSNSNYVYGNTLALNQDAGFIVNGSNDNRIELNTVTQNGDAGGIVGRSIGSVILNNTLSGSSDAGIFLEYSTDNWIQGNDVRFNTGGVELTNSHRNRVQLNDASNTTGIGIELQDAHANTITHNTANANGAQGIHAGSEAPEQGEQGSALGTVIECNAANGNQGDGIVLATPGHTMRMNVANLNDGWGMHAAVGNVDAGGNDASGNTEALQCFGLFCSPAPRDCPPPPPPPPPPSVPPVLHSPPGPTAAPEVTLPPPEALPAAAPPAPTVNGSPTANGSHTALSRCRVPKVKGRKFFKARRAIVRAGCRVGKVRWRKSKTRRGIVVAQSPRPGRFVKRGYKVNLVRSKGRRASRA
jgi:parallel beta-helix repeat protein